MRGCDELITSFGGDPWRHSRRGSWSRRIPALLTLAPARLLTGQPADHLVRWRVFSRGASIRLVWRARRMPASISAPRPRRARRGCCRRSARRPPLPPLLLRVLGHVGEQVAGAVDRTRFRSERGKVTLTAQYCRRAVGSDQHRRLRTTRNSTRPESPVGSRRHCGPARPTNPVRRGPAGLRQGGLRRSTTIPAGVAGLG
jgi:hypothetical protein